MNSIDINQALPQMKKLLEIASNGEEIIITQNNQPMVKLVSIQNIPKRSPLFGSDQNIISISDDFDEPLEDYINEKTKLEDFDLLPIQLNYLGLITTLPFHHNDPFDRLLITQAITEKIPILSRDIAFDDYQIQRIWD